MSSAGIGVLVRYHQLLIKNQGQLVVSVASAPVKRVLEMAKLGTLILAEATVRPVAGPAVPRQLDRARPTFAVTPFSPAAMLSWRSVGDPDVLRGRPVEERHSRKLRFRESAFGVGLGAFGSSFDECCDRFGDFVVVAGAAAYQPADGSNIADHLVSSGALVPELIVLFGIVCE